jgi:hypothetical protein
MGGLRLEIFFIECLFFSIKDMKLKPTVTCLGLLLLSGCASVAKESEWIPTFGTYENFDKSIAECEYDLELMGKSITYKNFLTMIKIAYDRVKIN